jgi:hypothetical protein
LRASSSRQNTADASNRTGQNQSIDPSRAISAAVWQSPISA